MTQGDAVDGLELMARRHFTQVLDSSPQPESIDPDLDMAGSYGLTSLNKVIFLMSLCDDTGVSLSNFAEPDVAEMQSLNDVIRALAAHMEPAP